MKHFILMLLIASTVTGCIKEDERNCENAESSLIFSYKGDGDSEIFQSKIASVNMYVYGENNNLLQQITLNKNQLESNQGAKLKLSAGTYRIVCWGNVFSNTSIINEDNQLIAELSHPDYYAQNTIKSNDSLYYAYRTLEIPAQGMRDTIHFAGAHIKFNVYLHGSYSSQLSKSVVSNYSIRLNNLPPTYDFNMQRLKPLLSYFPDGTTDDVSQSFLFKFNILRISDDNQVSIDLIDKQTNNAVYTLALKDYMEQYGIHVNNKHEASITVHFNISPLGISILPWEAEEIQPEL